MKVWEIEDKIWNVEGIRIAVRAPGDATVKDYAWTRAAEGGWRLSELINNRIASCIEPYGCIVIDGYGVQPHRGSKLPTIRDSYKKVKL